MPLREKRRASLLQYDFMQKMSYIILFGNSQPGLFPVDAGSNAFIKHFNKETYKKGEQGFT